ncbi:hypothetical protein B2H83_24815 [Escherichia coli M8]|nr:hypothetical protein B2H83_24815 [Escherichia coli M8]
MVQAGTARTTHSIKLWCRVPPGAWRRLHTRRVGIHRRSTVSLNLNPRALSRIHHNSKNKCRISNM